MSVLARIVTCCLALVAVFVANGLPLGLREHWMGASWWAGMFDTGEQLTVLPWAAIQCEPIGGCLIGPLGAALGGLGFVVMNSGYALALFLTLQIIMFLLGDPSRRARYGVIATGLVYGAATLGMWVVFDTPPATTIELGNGFFTAVAAAGLALLAQSNLYERLDRIELERWETVEIPPPPPDPGQLVTVATGALAHASLSVWSVTGEQRRVTWADMTAARLHRDEHGEVLDLFTGSGDVVRVTAASRIDYHTLPGGDSDDPAVNLRRLHAYARARNSRLA